MTTAKGTVHRCAWAQGDDLLRAYHDEEWGVPERDDRALWEALMLDGFQAGLSWTIILRKREAFRRAFAGFDPQKVARFGEKDILRLLGDEGIVRSRAKIEATIQGAKIFVAMTKTGESFTDFVWSFTGGKTLEGGATRLTETPVSQAMSKAFKARGFKFVGPVIVYAWMQAVGMTDDHEPTCFRKHAHARRTKPAAGGRRRS